MQKEETIPCQFCGRTFSETAGKRHIPHCEKKYNDKRL